MAIPDVEGLVAVITDRNRDCDGKFRWHADFTVQTLSREDGSVYVYVDYDRRDGWYTGMIRISLDNDARKALYRYPWDDETKAAFAKAFEGIGYRFKHSEDIFN